MNIHGYAAVAREMEQPGPSELAEITLVANPNELRRIAKFLLDCANGMEAHGSSWEHEHLADRDRSFSNSPHFVVFNPEYGK